MIGVCHAYLYALSTATSILLANTTYKAVSIVIGSFLFHTVLSPVQIVGLVVCMVGGVVFCLGDELQAFIDSVTTAGSRLDELEKRVVALEQGKGYGAVESNLGD